MSALLALTGFANAQTTDYSAYSGLDNKIKGFMDTWEIPGASVAITKDGKTIYSKAFGYSDQAHTKPAKEGELYRIASVSKPVTSIGIMKLVEEGKLSLEDKVFGCDAILDQEYYLNTISDQRIYLITVGQLLEHTAGWDRRIPYGGFSHSDPAFFPLHVTATLHEPNPVGDSTLIKFSLKKGLDHQPGSVYAYSNVGYLILGKVIEKISGMSYEAFIQKNILEPLDIHDMQLGKNLLVDKKPNEVEYLSGSTTRSSYGTGALVPWQYGGFNVEAMNAHGGWIASASDLNKIMLALNGSENGTEILRPETISLMSSPGSVNAGYAKGWFVNSANNWWHTGSMDGTASFVCRTSNGYTWTFLLNSRSDNSSAFWNAFDRLPWECVRAISDIAKNTPGDDTYEEPKYPLRGVTP
ncbi:MAG: class beta-lactamase-related serine hydrolase [Bacteroidota bacterium]|jgi:CubicO group peptidase (beta-lactamase class C family)|nr:class beta-lactamase-related serine hydrolase [Bacteroidota bacterium]